MMTREEYIQMEMTSHRELSMDINAFHGISIPEFDRSEYDVMSDDEINVKIRKYEESLESSLTRKCNYNTDTGEIFYETVYTADGQVRRQLKEQLTESHKTSGFTYYDNSHGHCAICGRLGCHGSCFK